MSAPAVIGLIDKLATFADTWNPRIIGRYNDCELRVARLEGAFQWHRHVETDELFFVVDGMLRMEFRDGERMLHPGDLLVVPRGMEHRPVAEPTCSVLLIDREGEPNTGSNPSERTREHLESLE